MKPTITFISDNYLLSTLLQSSLSGHFAEVTRVTWKESSAETILGGSGLILLDVESAETCAAFLREALGEKRSLHLVILLLRSEEQGMHFQELLGAIGAMLPPLTSAADLASVANAINEGLCIWPRSMVKYLIRDRMPRQVESGAAGTLTKQEKLVLEHLSSGESNKAIASALNITDSTVRVHVRAVIRKLGVKNRTQAVLRGYSPIGAHAPSGKPTQRFQDLLADDRT